MGILVPCSFAQIIEQIGIAYVVPIAQCDLELTLKDKGILNSAGYTGKNFSFFLKIRLSFLQRSI